MSGGTLRTVLLIAGMRDNACRERLSEVLSGVEGVEEVHVSLLRAIAVVHHHPSCETGALVDAVAHAGYSATSEADV